LKGTNKIKEEIMERIIERVTDYGAYGYYQPQEGDIEPSCGWSWDAETGIISDNDSFGSVTVGYAATIDEI